MESILDLETNRGRLSQRLVSFPPASVMFNIQWTAWWSENTINWKHAKFGLDNKNRHIYQVETPLWVMLYSFRPCKAILSGNLRVSCSFPWCLCVTTQKCLSQALMTRAWSLFGLQNIRIANDKIDSYPVSSLMNSVLFECPILKFDLFPAVVMKPGFACKFHYKVSKKVQRPKNDLQLF